ISRAIPVRSSPSSTAPKKKTKKKATPPQKKKKHQNHQPPTPTPATSPAHDYVIKVAVHAHGAEAIRRSVIAGVDSVEHGTFMDDADIALMKQHGTFYCPTVFTGEFVAEQAK